MQSDATPMLVTSSMMIPANVSSAGALIAIAEAISRSMKILVNVNARRGARGATS